MIIPACVIAGVVIVGDIAGTRADPAVGSIALARPKSSTFTVPSVADLDVRGLEIAMDDALLVRRFERLGDLLARSAAPRRRGWPARDPLRQILALDQFHDERAQIRCPSLSKVLQDHGCARCSGDSVTRGSGLRG